MALYSVPARVPARPLTKNAYPHISEIFAPEFGEMEVEDAISIFEQANIDPDVMEFSLKSLKRFGKKLGSLASKVVKTAAPIAGAVIGGPAGAAIGGTLGGMVGNAMASGSVASLSPSAALSQLSRQAVLPIAGQSQAATQLLQLLYRPEVMKALTAMSMGKAGAPNIRFGKNSAAPPSAFTSAIASLAKKATEDYNVLESQVRPYRMAEDYAGEKTDDPAEAATRAVKFLQELQEADPDPGQDAGRPGADARRAPAESVDEAYDELAMIELYGDPENWG